MEGGESVSLLMSLKYKIKRGGPRMDPCGISECVAWRESQK